MLPDFSQLFIITNTSYIPLGELFVNCKHPAISIYIVSNMFHCNNESIIKECNACNNYVLHHTLWQVLVQLHMLSS